MSSSEDPSNDAESEVREPLNVTIHETMGRAAYRRVKDQWDKANDRLLDDPAGAITAARTLLETTCKQILGELKIPIAPSADIPKLCNETCKALGIAPGEQLDPLYRSIFSAVYTIIKAVGEIRNKVGDAHGASGAGPKPSQADAQLAVHLAGATSNFLAARFESYLNATRRLTPDGKVILKFDKSTVWRLVDHAANAPTYQLYYGEDLGRCLMLVGDAGIYLMSNGTPPMYHDGTLRKGDDTEHNKTHLIAEAEGCGSSADIDDWWPLHNALNEGSDFAQPIPVEEVRRCLHQADHAIVIVADAESFSVMSDVEFERRSSS